MQRTSAVMPARALDEKKGEEAGSRPYPLLAVFAWELCYRLASRSSKILVALAFVLFLLVSAVSTYNISPTKGLFAPSTTMLGIVVQVLYNLLLPFSICVPFLTADTVAHDYKQRVHELLMTTAVPTRAYVWGRYLAGLCASLLFSLLMLLGVLGSGLLWHLIIHPSPQYKDVVAVYPLPDLATLILTWVFCILPVALLLSGLSFVCSTLWPRASGRVKMFVLLGWIACLLFVTPRFLGPNMAWDPTGNAIAGTLLGQYQATYRLLAAHMTSLAQRQDLAYTLAQHIPDFVSRLFPHLVYGLVGLACATLAALCFRRFRDMLN